MDILCFLFKSFTFRQYVKTNCLNFVEFSKRKSSKTLEESFLKLTNFLKKSSDLKFFIF